MNFFRKSLFLIFLLIPAFAFAEYRVFLLKISKAGAAANSQDFRLVESTLDPVQYRGYYTVAIDEEVSYIATWRCYGRTDGFKPHCPNPKSAPEPAP